jgi:uncharacterized membrane protein YdjX (TVP38/TMEM64 family)
MHNRNKFLIFIIAIVLLWYLGRASHIDAQGIENYFKRFPVVYSGILYIALYVVVTFFIWLSKDVFRFAAAIVFGAYWSTLFIWIAETVNAVILFYCARYLGRSFVEKSLKGSSKNLDQKLVKINFFWLFLFRATPLIPFRFLDLASGLTSIAFSRYMWAVVFGSPLRIFWVQYILAGVGKSIFRDPGALSGYLSQNPAVFVFSLIYILVVFLVALKLKMQR